MSASSLKVPIRGQKSHSVRDPEHKKLAWNFMRTTGYTFADEGELMLFLHRRVLPTHVVTQCSTEQIQVPRNLDLFAHLTLNPVPILSTAPIPIEQPKQPLAHAA